MRAPSEAANLQILLFRVGEKHWVRAFSVSLFPLIPLLSRPAVTKKENVVRSTSTKARERPQRSGKLFNT